MGALAMQVGAERGDRARRGAALWRWQRVVESLYLPYISPRSPYPFPHNSDKARTRTRT